MKKTQPGWWDRFIIGVKKWLGLHVLLCDSCRWNWRGVCRNPARPNATWCPDYERRG